MNLEILVTPTTSLRLLLAMAQWCEGKIELKEYVLLNRFHPVIPSDKEERNSLHSVMGEVGLWNLQRS